MSRTRTPLNHVDRRVWPLLIGAAGFAVFYWPVLISGFGRIWGHDEDPRFVLYILEHLHRSLIGLADWRNPPMFFPLPGTLAWSDALLLFLPLYSPIRLLGADPFLAFQLTLMGLSIAGFAGAFVLGRQVLRLSAAASAWAAALFAFSNQLHVQHAHVQMYAVLLLPGLLWLIVRGIEAVESRRAGWRFWSLPAAGVLAGLLFSTAFYVGWLGLLCLGPALLLTVWRLAPVAGWPAAGFRQILRISALFGGGLATALLPFLLLYLPAIHQGLGRSWADVAERLGLWVDLGNVGRGNLLWGGWLPAADQYQWEGIIDRFDFVEFSVAPTPVLLLCGLTGAGLLLRSPASARHLPGWFTVTALVLWLSAFDFTGWSPWSVIWSLVPGAQAVRAPLRLALILGVCLPPLAVWAVLRLGSGRRGFKAAALVLGLVITLEQVNLEDAAHMDRAEERTRLQVSSAPAICRSFALVAQDGHRLQWFRQIDAMLIAQASGLPTINGYSGFDPPGWDLVDPDALSYRLAVARWADRHDLRSGLCAYDDGTRQWQEPGWLPPSDAPADSPPVIPGLNRPS
jgi:hypothetical protein